MMKEITIDSILNVINLTGKISVTSNQVNESLIELGMDSITFIQIVVCLEEYFDCEIPDSMLLIDKMDTIEKMYKIVKDLSC